MREFPLAVIVINNDAVILRECFEIIAEESGELFCYFYIQVDFFDELFLFNKNRFICNIRHTYKMKQAIKSVYNSHNNKR